MRDNLLMRLFLWIHGLTTFIALPVLTLSTGNWFNALTVYINLVTWTLVMDRYHHHTLRHYLLPPLVWYQWWERRFHTE
jgi:hypothetical protein